MSMENHLNSLQGRLSAVEEKLSKAPSWDQALVTKIKRERLVLRDRIRHLRKEEVA